MAVPEKLKWKLELGRNTKIAPLALALVEAAEKQGATLEELELASRFAVYMIRSSASIEKKSVGELSSNAKTTLKGLCEGFDTFFE